jgi:isoleucyl-tRNA synthetase
MPPLEKFILHRLHELDGQVRAALESYRFSDVVRPISEFCSNELSSLYFDIRKDSLYCDRPDSDRRRACRTVMDAVFERLTAWLSPFLIFTMEEAWTRRFPEGGSNCARVLPETPAAWRNEAEAERWAKVQRVLEQVTDALEAQRREKVIGSALEAAPEVAGPAGLTAAFDGLDAAEVFRTSGAQLSVGGDEVRARFHHATGEKCDRCWRVLPEVKPATRTCLRCEEAVAAWDAAHA